MISAWITKTYAWNPKKLPCGRLPAHSDDLPTAEQFSQWKEQLRVFLSTKGLKYSEQRWKIAELILSAGGHLDPQGILDRVKLKHPEIGVATVYRNLKVLCDAEILRETLTDANGRVIYELYDGGHHDHIVCTDCGEIFEFHSDKIEDLQTEVVEKMQFAQVRHRHVIYARCKFT